MYNRYNASVRGCMVQTGLNIVAWSWSKAMPKKDPSDEDEPTLPHSALVAQERGAIVPGRGTDAPAAKRERDDALGSLDRRGGFMH